MSVSDYLAGVALAVSIGGILYREGVARERFRNLELQTKQWADGLGRILRESRAKDERRWKHGIATHIGTAKTLDEAKEYAKLLREDAWRD